MTQNYSNEVNMFKKIYAPSIIDYSKQINSQFRGITPKPYYTKTKIDLVDTNTRMQLEIKEDKVDKIKIYEYTLFIGYEEIALLMENDEDLNLLEAFYKVVTHEYLHILCGHFDIEFLKSLKNFMQGKHTLNSNKIFMLEPDKNINFKIDNTILNIAGDLEINNILNMKYPFFRASDFGFPEGLNTIEYYSIVHHILDSFPKNKIKTNNFCSSGKSNFFSDYYSNSKEKIRKLFKNVSLHISLEDCFIEKGNFVQDREGFIIYDDNDFAFITKNNSVIQVNWKESIKDEDGEQLVEDDGTPFLDEDGFQIFGKHKAPIFDGKGDKIEGKKGKIVLNKNGGVLRDINGNPIYLNIDLDKKGIEYDNYRFEKIEKFKKEKKFENLQGNITGYIEKFNISETGIWKEFKDLLKIIKKKEQNMKITLIDKNDDWCKFNNRKDSSLLYPGKIEKMGSLERKLGPKSTMFIDISGSMYDVIEPLFTFCFFLLKNIDIELIFYDTEIKYIFNKSKDIKLEPFVCGGTNAFSAIKEYEKKYHKPRKVYIISDCYDYTLKKIIEEYDSIIWKLEINKITKYGESK